MRRGSETWVHPKVGPDEGKRRRGDVPVRGTGVATGEGLTAPEDESLRVVERDLRSSREARTSLSRRVYRLMEEGSEREHLVKHVLSEREAWEDLVGRGLRYDRAKHRFLVALKENRWRRAPDMFRGVADRAVLFSMARHVILQDAFAGWQDVLKRLHEFQGLAKAMSEVDGSTRATAVEQEALGANLGKKGELRCREAGKLLERRCLCPEVTPFISEYASVEEALKTQFSFQEDFDRARKEIRADLPYQRDAVLLALLDPDFERNYAARLVDFIKMSREDSPALVPAYRRAIDDTVREAAGAPSHSEYLYRVAPPNEAYVGTSGIVVCLRPDGGEFRVSTAYRSGQGVTPEERRREATTTFMNGRNVTVTRCFTREAWGRTV